MAGVGQAGNFGATFTGYAVGNPEWIESQASKVGMYFRSIEYGTHGFVGRVLAGAFGFGSRGDRIYPDIVPFGAQTSNQSFVPFAPSLRDNDLALGASRASQYLRQLGFGRVPTIAVVQHEIEPHLAYEKGAAEFDPVAREVEAIKQAFANSGLTLSDRSGRTTPTKAQTAGFAPLSRGGFLSGHALSTSSRSLGNIDQVFRAELTEANRILALELAESIAEFYGPEHLKRPEASTGKLQAATLAPQNRFPT